MARVCRDAPDELRAFAESLKPYLGGDSFLWAVSSLAGPGKHQKSINIAPLADGMIMHSEGLYVPGPATIGIGKLSDLRNEFEFARYPAVNKFQMKFDVPLQIVIGDVDIVGGQEALSVLNEYARKVESIVLGIEAETARILASRP